MANGVFTARMAVGKVNSPLKRNSPTPSALRRRAWLWVHLRPMGGRDVRLRHRQFKMQTPSLAFKQFFGLPHGRGGPPRPVTHDGTRQSAERPSAVGIARSHTRELGTASRGSQTRESVCLAACGDGQRTGPRAEGDHRMWRVQLGAARSQTGRPWHVQRPVLRTFRPAMIHKRVRECTESCCDEAT